MATNGQITAKTAMALMCKLYGEGRVHYFAGEQGSTPEGRLYQYWATEAEEEGQPSENNTYLVKEYDNKGNSYWIEVGDPDEYYSDEEDEDDG